MVYKFLSCLFKRKTNVKFCLLLWKHLLIPKIVPKAASNFCSGFLLLSLVDFFQCTFIADFRSQAGFGTTFRDTGGSQKAGASSLKRVAGNNFTISIWAESREQKLYFRFPSQETVKNGCSAICYPATRPSKLLDGYQGHPLFLSVAWDRPAATEPGSETVYTRHTLFSQHL